MSLEVPAKGFTQNERKWLKDLVEAVNRARIIQGENIKVSEEPDGVKIAADDCDCDLCP